MIYSEEPNTYELEKLGKSTSEELTGLLKKPAGCIAFDRRGNPILANGEALNCPWDEIDSRKSSIQAIEDAARRLIAID